MFGSNFPNPPGYYEFSNTIRVDQEGNGDFLTVKEACDHAATLSRGRTNVCMIHVNAGEFFEEPFTVPSWCIINGFGDAGETFEPSTSIIRLLALASETSFVTMENSSVITDCTITVEEYPDDFDSDYSVVDMVASGSGTTGLTGVSKINGCKVFPVDSYGGDNIARVIHSEDGIEPFLIRSELLSSGPSTIVLDCESSRGLAYYCSIIPRTRIKYTIRMNNSNSADSARGMKLQFCRLEAGLVPPYNSFQTADLAIIKVDDVNARVYLWGTRIPLNERTGAGSIYEVHATPQQLSTSFTAAIVTTAVSYNFDGFVDGTVLAGGGITINLPPSSDIIVGQGAVVFSTGDNVTINGAGNTINGSATLLLRYSNSSAVLQWDGTEWKLIAGTAASVISEDIVTQRTLAVSTSLVSTDQQIYASSAANAVVLTLPVAASTPIGKTISIKATSEVTTFQLSVTAPALDDGTTFIFSVKNEYARFRNDGVQWWVVS